MKFMAFNQLFAAMFLFWFCLNGLARAMTMIVLERRKRRG